MVHKNTIKRYTGIKIYRENELLDYEESKILQNQCAICAYKVFCRICFRQLEKRIEFYDDKSCHGKKFVTPKLVEILT